MKWFWHSGSAGGERGSRKLFNPRSDIGVDRLS
jgi:hypothetical protein